MKRRPSSCSAIVSWLVGFAVAIVPSSGRAFPIFPAELPNTVSAFDETTGEDTPCISCHNNPAGGNGCDKPEDNLKCWNPFGFEFNDAGRVWNAGLASGDADGDGFTNGQELQDPYGEWTRLSGAPRPGNPDHVTAPGDPNDTPGDTDFDGDTYCYFGRDLNFDGDCKDEGENAGGPADRDCDDSSFVVNSGLPEDCTNAIDNDCDGFPTLTDDECADVVDNDGDGFCETGQDLNGDRLCLDDEQGGETDCNDNAATVYPGAPVNCVDGLDNDCDDLVDLDDAVDCNQNDLDGDGWCPFGQDTRGATEGSPPDGDCDDLGESPLCVDLNADGDCDDPGEDSGEPLAAYDCNDTRTDINPEVAEICGDGIDNDCAQGADYVDLACRHLVDQDGDGVCPEGLDLDLDGNCNGTGEQDGCVDRVCDPSVIDCDDTRATRAPTLPENCIDTELDVDCDGLPSVDFSVAAGEIVLEAGHDPDCSIYVDFDGDGYCAAGEDGDAGWYDRDCIDNAESVGAADCNDDPAMGGALVNPVATESGYALCSDGLDNDCDGLTDNEDSAEVGGCADWNDADGDGFCPLGTDLDGDGGCTGLGEDTGPQDCNDANPLVSPVAHENCIDELDNDCNGLADYLLDGNGEPLATNDPACVRDMDADGDGFCPFGVDTRGDAEGSGPDGDCLDPGENIGVSDCNDDPTDDGALQHPLAQESTPEQCADLRDNDCDTYVDTADMADEEVDYLRASRPNCRPYLDLDGDSFCLLGRDLRINGVCLDAGEQGVAAMDCDDTSTDVYPGRREICDDGLDNDCNGLADARDYPQCQCAADAECDDADPCTMDTCSARGECRYATICSDAGSGGDSGPLDGGSNDAGTLDDAGASDDAGEEAGSEDAAAEAGDGGEGGSGGKGCSAVGSPARGLPLGALLWAGLAALTVWRRRRREV